MTARRIIVKIGSSLLASGGNKLNTAYIGRLSAQIAAQRQAGLEVVLVSSGAVVAGMQRLGWQKRPRTRADLQVAAAIGQMRLMNAYEDAFSRRGLHAAQVLLTAEEMAHRTLYLNARATLRRLLVGDFIPVINENDVVATDTASFGDNDRLAALIANLLEADCLLMLTDAPGLCRDSARSDVIYSADAGDDDLLRYVVEDGGASRGLGGMQSKLAAAKIAARSGANSLIIDGRARMAIARAIARINDNDNGGKKDDNKKTAGRNFGTLLAAGAQPLSARKRWLASGLRVRGTMYLDAGAVRAVVRDKRSLLPAGVRRVRGDFVRGDSVAFADDDGGAVVGYGLTNYDAAAARALCGVKSGEIEKVLGYAYEEEMAHRDNMTVLE
ncbi:MAG: glutamate 5-kinase [Gammaproteobacteria bacterium]